jgi:hypothetical protein
MVVASGAREENIIPSGCGTKHPLPPRNMFDREVKGEASTEK